MKIIKPSYRILTPINGENILKRIEIIGHLEYNKRNKVTNFSSHEFILDLIKKSNLSIIKHVSVTIKFIIDGGSANELFNCTTTKITQENTGFVLPEDELKGGGLSFILPQWIDDNDLKLFNTGELPEDKSKISWYLFISSAEEQYLEFINKGVDTNYVKDFLLSATKTELIITANLEEWRNILIQKTLNYTSPTLLFLMRNLLKEFKNKIPILFDDILY